MTQQIKKFMFKNKKIYFELLVFLDVKSITLSYDYFGFLHLVDEDILESTTKLRDI